MATIRLIPSVLYNAAGTSYLSVSNEDNAFANTDSTNYATIQNTYASTSNRYIYLRGFNFDDIPSGAIINSFTVKLKAYESGISTSSSYVPYLCNGTTTLSGCTTTAISTSASVHTFTCGLDLDTIKSYGSNFGIRINCRRYSRNSTGYMYIYGAEIEVDYTIPVAATVTSTLSGSGTISPSGATSTYEGAEYELTITPTDSSAAVTATKNGTDITSQLVRVTGETVTVVPESETTSSIQSGASYAAYAVGHSAESPSSSGTSSNMYAASGNTGYAEYSFDFSDIPSEATITDIEVRCYGHRENSTIDSTHISQCAIYDNGTAISEAVDFQSTSNAIITLTPTTIPSSLSNVTVRHFVGYYGGLVLGISFDVTYEINGVVYKYTYTVDGDATIAVAISGSSTPPTITVGTPSRSIISDETGYDQCVCTFQSNMALQAWEARATKSGVTPARGVGLLVESGTTLAANTDATIYVDDEELTQGDGEYTITVYGQSTGGVWSE